MRFRLRGLHFEPNGSFLHCLDQLKNLRLSRNEGYQISSRLCYLNPGSKFEDMGTKFGLEKPTKKLGTTRVEEQGRSWCNKA